MNSFIDKNNIPKVTVATVCYNSQSTIEKTISSVLKQTYPNIEYIIVDGLSSDGTVDVINKYCDEIDVFVSEKDSGPSEGQRKAVSMASGELIMFLFADDWIPETYISDAVNFILDNEVSFVFGDVKYYDELNDYRYTVKGDPDYKDKIKYTMPRINYTSIVGKIEMYRDTEVNDDKYHVAPDYLFMRQSDMKGFVGKYFPGLTCFNHVGGNSHRQHYQGIVDVRNIAIECGASRLVANFYFYKRILGHNLLSIVRAISHMGRG